MRARYSFLIAACLVAMAFAGCSQEQTTVRPYPAGDRSAAARPPNPSAENLSRSDLVPIVPGHLYIPSIGVNATVMSLGTEMAPDPFLQGRQVASFVVPPDLARVGWWSDGPRLGARGMAVLLGHSQVGGGAAVFNRLGDLRAGDQIDVENAEATSRISLTVTRVVDGIAKDDETALQIALADNARTSDLAMITCSGDFDTAKSESRQNTAVFANIR